MTVQQDAVMSSLFSYALVFLIVVVVGEAIVAAMVW